MVSRLKKRTDFTRVGRGRFWFKSLSVLVQSCPSECLYVGFTASKKHVSKHAVLRNRAKRRLRAWVDTELRQYTEQGTFVFVANSRTATMPFCELSSECARAVLGCIQKWPRS